jgi:hypothetical protein
VGKRTTCSSVRACLLVRGISDRRPTVSRAAAARLTDRHAQLRPPAPQHVRYKLVPYLGLYISVVADAGYRRLLFESTLAPLSPL